MDCLLEIPGVDPVQSGLSAEKIRALGYDGVALSVDAARLAGDEAGRAALVQQVAALRAADLTVPLVKSDVTYPEAEPTKILFSLCDDANVRLVRVGCWPYEFPGYRAQARHAGRLLEQLQSLAEGFHLRLIVPAWGRDSIQAGSAATRLWLQECDSRLVGMSVGVELSRLEGEAALELELAGEWLALVDVLLRPETPVHPDVGGRLAGLLRDLRYNKSVCVVPPDGVGPEAWSAEAATVVQAVRSGEAAPPSP